MEICIPTLDQMSESALNELLKQAQEELLSAALPMPRISIGDRLEIVDFRIGLMPHPSQNGYLPYRTLIVKTKSGRKVQIAASKFVNDHNIVDAEQLSDKPLQSYFDFFEVLKGRKVRVTNATFKDEKHTDNIIFANNVEIAIVA